jgi:death-on-curing protein
MKQPVWIIDSVVVAIHEMLLAEHGGLTGVRDAGLLDSALAKPKQRHAYQQDSSIFELAAAYSLGIIKNHPFVDGNKRTAFTLAAIFLELNGVVFNAPEAEVVVYYEGLAAGDVTEKELVSWLEKSSV